MVEQARNLSDDKINRSQRSRRWGRSAVKLASAMSIGTLAVLAPEGAQHTTPHGIVWESKPTLGNTGVTLETPLGMIKLPTHQGPFGLKVRILDIPVERTLDTLQSGDKSNDISGILSGDIAEIKREVQKDLQKDLLRLMLGGSIGWVAGEAMVQKDKQSRKQKAGVLARGVLVGTLVAGSVGGLTAATYDRGSSRKATYTGGIAYAKNQLHLLEKLNEHDELVAQTVRNYLSLSRSLQKINNSSQEPSACIMVVSDIHSRDVAQLLNSIIETSCVDAVLDAGDITEWGLPFEQSKFAGLGNVGVNYFVVKGNHDSPDTMEELRKIPNITVLDGQEVSIKGVRIIGVGDADYSPDDILSGQSDRVKLDKQTGQRLKAAVDQYRPDLAVVHKLSAANEVTSNTRMVISGHSHACSPVLGVSEAGTISYNVGTTGGANLRTFAGKCKSPIEESGQPQTFSIVYFDSVARPVYTDEFELSGLQPNRKLDLKITRRYLPCSGECDKPGQKSEQPFKVTTSSTTD